MRAIWRSEKNSSIMKNWKTIIVLLLVVLTIVGLLQRLIPSEVFPIPVLYPRIQGLYESCSPSRGDLCLDRLKQMAATGFKLVINYDQFSGTVQQEIAYAKQAQALGMKVIWAMNDPVFWNGTDLLSNYNDFASGCECSDNQGFIRFFLGLAKVQPATWGYYIGDEVQKQDHARVKAFADIVKQLDPTHPRLFVSGEDVSTMGANLIPFVDTADVIGADIYPISTSESIDAVGKIAHAIQLIANRYHKQSMLVLQAFSWAQYAHATWVCSPFPSCAHFPTKDEMRQMRDLATKNMHLQFILWYSYFDILNSDQPYIHLIDLDSATSSTLNARDNR